MLLFWVIVFVVSLVAVVKGADWMLDAAEKIGLAVGLSPFVIGVVIVGLGTSFPELVAALAAIIQGANEIVVSNAVGSNIANILLVIGLSAIVGKRLSVTKNLIDIDIPLLAITTALFLIAVWDGRVTRIEALLLVLAYAIYLIYSIAQEEESGSRIEAKDVEEVLPARHIRRRNRARGLRGLKNIHVGDVTFLLLGIGVLVVGARYLVDSVVALSGLLGIGTGVIALAAVALGTSVPEILVSVRAAWRKQSAIALGNIFGSNVFNLLLVVGIPGLIRTLPLDAQTLSIGIPTLVIATALFLISSISKNIHRSEGLLYIIIYLFFLGKLFALF